MHQEYGVELYIAIEYGTRRGCSICHVEHEDARIHGGLYMCKRTCKNMDADLNAAKNTACMAGYNAEVKKIDNHVAAHDSIRSAAPARRG